MKLYLAGPMRGIEEFNFPAFTMWAGMLRSEGHEVFNPAERDASTGLDTAGMSGDLAELDKVGFSLREALAADVEYVAKEAEAVAVMPGWKESTGVAAEVALARAIGIPVVRVHHFTADGNPPIKTQAEARLLDVRNEEKTLGGRTYATHTSTTNGQTFIYNTPTVPTTETIKTILDFDSRPTGEVRTTSSTGGQKGVKPQRMSLVPVGPLLALAQHFGVGALKYDDHQWRKGYEWSKSYDALLRHLFAFWGGEDIDEETGSLHLDAVMWHAFVLRQFYDDFQQFDDRYKYPAA